MGNEIYSLSVLWGGDKMKIIKAPNTISLIPFEPAIFLAGSIEMGKAENWQQRIERELTKCDGVIFNPRRDDWDSSWI